LFSIYIAPSENNNAFHCTLDELSSIIRTIGGNRIIITEDFNSKSILWGSSRSDWRGTALERWAGLDLRLINRGNSPTCVRENSCSVIDLTWSSADICPFFSDWQVLSDAISLSDHKYIVYRVGGPLDARSYRRAHYARWNAKTLDKELFGEVLTWLLEGGFPVIVSRRSLAAYR